MAAQAINLGGQVADDASVYRGFPVEGFRHRAKNKIRRKAFYRSKDHTDGLSVGLTAEDSIAGFVTNCGYCELPVGPVHQLPHDLKILIDLAQQGHAVITNLPFFDGTDEEREMAEVISGKLVKIAKLITCNSYPPKPPSDLPNPAV